MDITQKLNHLAELKSERDTLELSRDSMIDKILAPEIKKQIEDIRAEFAGPLLKCDENIAALEAEIKTEVLTGGQSVKGQFFHAVWMKGRVSWDTKALDGYATAHPEVEKFRKEGEPTVSIRPAK